MIIRTILPILILIITAKHYPNRTSSSNLLLLGTTTKYYPNRTSPSNLLLLGTTTKYYPNRTSSSNLLLLGKVGISEVMMYIGRIKPVLGDYYELDTRPSLITLLLSQRPAGFFIVIITQLIHYYQSITTPLHPCYLLYLHDHSIYVD